MHKEYKVYVDDILDSIGKIKEYTKGMMQKEFIENTLVVDAVVRNLEVIGEAVKKLPLDLKRKYSEVEWEKIAGLRDILIHEYFGINLDIIWDIVINKVPELEVLITKIRNEIE